MPSQVERRQPWDAWYTSREVQTTITHPASTTHGRAGAEARRAAGINEGLLRIAVGAEDPADLIDDLGRALRAAR